MQSNIILFAITSFLGFCLSSPTSIEHSLVARDASSDCDGGTYSGGYSDGSGTYVNSDSVTHPYKFPLIRKCWKDYFIVEQSIWYQPWKKSSGNRYCTGTSTCQVSELVGTQFCQTRSETVSANIGIDIEGIKLGVEASYSLDNQNCFSATDTTVCTWNDSQCHTVWTQQQMVKSLGYVRKRCNWGDGDETECMSNIEVNTPTNFVNYGCGSKCEDTNDCGHTDGTPCP